MPPRSRSSSSAIQRARRSAGRRARWLLAKAVAVVVTAVVLAQVPSARGETIEELINPRTTHGSWVSDGAGVLSDATEAELNANSDALQRANGAELAIVTLRDTGDRTSKEFSTELFHRWGIGKADRDNGIMILLAVESRRVEVEVGYGLEPILPDGKVGRILHPISAASYRQDRWEEGTLALAKALGAAITEAKEGVPAKRGTRGSGRGHGAEALVVFGGALAGVAGTGWYVRRRRWIRHCERCRKTMTLLSEQADDAYLSEGEVFEESIGSMNHVVWRCASCDVSRIEHRRARGGSYAECPRCHLRTLRTDNVVLQHPTTTEEGRKEVTRVCARSSCAHRESEIVSIALISPVIAGSSDGGSGSDWSSSSSGSSSSSSDFGGGDSGGGGAGDSF